MDTAVGLVADRALCTDLVRGWKAPVRCLKASEGAALKE